MPTDNELKHYHKYLSLFYGSFICLWQNIHNYIPITFIKTQLESSAFKLW